MPRKTKNMKLKRNQRSRSISRSKRAGLILPVGRIHRLLKEGRYAKRVGMSAAIYMAAVVEYLLSEVLQLSANAACESGKLRISPRHLNIAIRKDNELKKLLPDIVIYRGGVVPREINSP